jgi:hypothetical protein
MVNQKRIISLCTQNSKVLKNRNQPVRRDGIEEWSDNIKTGIKQT